LILEPSPILLLIYIALPALISALLYVVVRFGVKHGMRAYYAEANRSPGD
jgi:hypothetical protein